MTLHIESGQGWAKIDVPSWSVSEVECAHSFELLSLAEVRNALNNLDEIMEIGGVLRLDASHRVDSLERLKVLMEEYGFAYVGEEKNILSFVKRGLRAPWQYVPINIPDSWRMADVGPGGYPHPRASVYIDKHAEILYPLAAAGKQVVNSNIEDGFPGIEDKAFDFVFCSHVLEHVYDPQAAAAALSRIGKRGVVVVPSFFKESLFGFEEPTHHWVALRTSKGKLLMVRRNEEFINALKDVDFQKIMSRLFRTGPNRMPEEHQYLRKWFHENERHTDIVIEWEGTLEVQVVA